MGGSRATKIAQDPAHALRPNYIGVLPWAGILGKAKNRTSPRGRVTQSKPKLRTHAMGDLRWEIYGANLGQQRVEWKLNAINYAKWSQANDE